MITSLANQKVKEINKLHQRKYRKDQYLLSDEDMILKALDKGLITRIIKVPSYDIAFDDIIEVSDEVMAKLSEGKDTKVMAVCKIIEEETYAKRALLLDDLADPQNIGMIIKAASIFGYDMIYLGTNCADIYNPKCLEKAGTSLYDVKIKKKDLDIVIGDLKKHGYQILATGLRKNTKDLYDTKGHDHLAIIMGNEGHGIKERYYTMTDEVIKIPMTNIDSLNVAVASAIVMEYYANSRP